VLYKLAALAYEKEKLIRCRRYQCLKFFSVAKFLVPDWEVLVDSCIGLSHRPARLHRMAGRYDNPMPESTISPSEGLRIRPL
jgi:hypothetical protein